jgi:hypothetical protein
MLFSVDDITSLIMAALTPRQIKVEEYTAEFLITLLKITVPATIPIVSSIFETELVEGGVRYYNTGNEDIYLSNPEPEGELTLVIACNDGTDDQVFMLNAAELIFQLIIAAEADTLNEFDRLKQLVAKWNFEG